MKRLMTLLVTLLIVSMAATAQNATNNNNNDPAANTPTTSEPDPAYDPEKDDCYYIEEGSTDPDPNYLNRPLRQLDCRGSFEASFYVGGAVDTFAGTDTLNYLNPSDTGKTTLREVAGFDFGYRLYGTRGRLTSNPRVGFLEGSQLWVYGETVHGVRSKELECRTEGDAAGSDANLPACKKTPEVGAPGTGELLAIIKGATSLEAFFGLRWEFAPVSAVIQQSELDRARFYLKAQLGAIAVSGGGDSSDMHHVGLGAIAISGPLEGSYLEVGYGRNDLMIKNHNGRWKLDGFLSVDYRAVPMLETVLDDARIRPFAQLTVDADFGGGADSLQTYFGLDFTFGKVIRKRGAQSLLPREEVKPDPANRSGWYQLLGCPYNCAPWPRLAGSSRSSFFSSPRRRSPTSFAGARSTSRRRSTTTERSTHPSATP